MLFPPSVGPALNTTERKSTAKETDALIYFSVSAVENYPSKILDYELVKTEDEERM